MTKNPLKRSSADLRARPILKWAGGKASLVAQLLPLFPRDFNRYFEPFFGGGAVYFALDVECKAYLNDSNKELVELYEVTRDTPELLAGVLDSLSRQYSETFYYSMRENVPHSKVERAARTIFLNKTCFNGLYRQNLKGQFNVPFGKRIQCPELYNFKNLQCVSNRLRNAILSAQDFETVIDQAGTGDFVYCDPPYEPLSRTSSFNSYQGGGFSQDEQYRLKNACMRAKERGASVIVSNSSAEFIKSLYADFDVRIISARRSINSKGNHRGEIEEVAVIIADSMS